MSEKKRFANKWSAAIEEHGYTSLPNLLLYQRKALGISVPQVYVILCLESFRWDDRNPFPSMEALSKRANISVRQVRNQIRALEKKGLVKRHYRKSATSTYNIEALIAKLDTIASSSLPPGSKLPPSPDKMRHIGGNDTSAKEDEANNTTKRPFIKNGLKPDVESAASIIDRHTENLINRSKSNDFGKGPED